MRKFAFVTLCAVALAACGDAQEQSATSEPEDSVEEVAVFPDSLAAFGDGYPEAGDACRRLGEGSATIDWLDDGATLVGCPTSDSAAALGGTLMGEVQGITVISIPSADSNEGMPEMPMQSPVAASQPSTPKEASAQILEKSCRAEVEKVVGAEVLNTLSSEFSQAGTMFRFEVEGAQAPWQCIGYSDGSVGGVMYTGSEGAL